MFISRHCNRHCPYVYVHTADGILMNIQRCSVIPTVIPPLEKRKCPIWTRSSKPRAWVEYNYLWCTLYRNSFVNYCDAYLWFPIYCIFAMPCGPTRQLNFSRMLFWVHLTDTDEIKWIVNLLLLVQCSRAMLTDQRCQDSSNSNCNLYADVS